MNQVLLQVVLAVVSWLGIPVSWVSGHRGQRRIRQPLSGIITNLGPLIMIAPWIVLPLMDQPHLAGSPRTIVFITGILMLVAAALMMIWATPYIFPAARRGGDELDPEFLVKKGPYRWVRHSQYLAAILGLIGWALVRGGLYSILLSPIGYLLFRFEAYLEESRVLEPKFGDKFLQFKKQVPTAILGRVGTILLLAAYLVFVSMVVSGRITTA